MAKIIIVEGDEVFVLPGIDSGMVASIKKNRVYDKYKGETRFSKDIRRQLLGLEIDRLKKELYLVDEG